MTAAQPFHPVTEDVDWFRITDAGSVGLVRRAAAGVADRLGLSEQRRGELAIVATELAGNLYKHAQDGSILLRLARSSAAGGGVELVAIDSGPGMADLLVSSRDGHSTAGTLGIGLGAIARQAARMDAYSKPGRGTVMVASVWADRPPPRPWADGLTRPIVGEAICGDGFAIRSVDGRHQVMVSDGLGHGALAADATLVAVQAFADAPPVPPGEVVEHLHRRLSRTRGAVIAVAEIGEDEVRFAGLGNIGGSVIGPAGRHGMVSLPGIAGHRRRDIREYRYAVPPGGAVVLHSDGLTDRWQPDDYPGLLEHEPLTIAATLLRDAGVRRDDACVLVANGPWA
jgi:anti-sigma regulatory factor (Ser/Thr protein kinase)